MLSFRTVWRGGIARAPALAAVAALGSTGCVVHGSDDSAFVVDWDLVYVGESERIACDLAGTPTVELVAERLYDGTVFRDEFPCDAYGSLSRVLPQGDYHVTIQLLDEERLPVSALEGDFPIYHDTLSDLGIIEFQVQTFVASWIVTQGNTSVGCADVGAAAVEMETQLGSDEKVYYLFPCDDAGGFTTAIPVGTYAVKARLLDASNQILSETAPEAVAVNASQRAVLAPFTFAVP